MQRKTAIDYLDIMLPLVTGCSKVGKGCLNCYACKLAATRLKHHPYYEGLAFRDVDDFTYEWTGEIRVNYDVLDRVTPRQKPMVVGLAFTGDLMLGSDSLLQAVKDACRRCPQHTFMFTTKRPEMLHRLGSDIPPNLWPGVSVWDQESFDVACLALSKLNAATWLSIEPMLGPIEVTPGQLSDYCICQRCEGTGAVATYAPITGEPSDCDRETCEQCDGTGRVECGRLIDLVIVGGESGKGARPMHPDWVTDILRDCENAGACFYFKQWGEWEPSFNFTEQFKDISPKTPVLRLAKDGHIGHSVAEMDGHERQCLMVRTGVKHAGNTLGGRQHLDLPWRAGP